MLGDNGPLDVDRAESLLMEGRDSKLLTLSFRSLYKANILSSWAFPTVCSVEVLYVIEMLYVSGQEGIEEEGIHTFVTPLEMSDCSLFLK